MSTLSNTYRWFKSYLSLPTLIVIAVVGYLIFTGENTVFEIAEKENQIDSLSRVLKAERDTMQYYRDLNQRLSTDAELMEQVVREQYGMKEANEDVYLTE